MSSKILANDSRHGHAVMEFALFLPFLLFTFVGVFDWGNYSWALMKTEGAARLAALYTSSSSSTAQTLPAHALTPWPNCRTPRT